MTNQKALTHYGILGMHWGRRKSESAPSSSDHTDVDPLRKKKVNQMSNDEIMKLTRRLNLEKQIQDLNLNSSVGKKGEKFAKNVIAAGTTVSALYAMTQTPVAKATINTIKEKVG